MSWVRQVILGCFIRSRTHSYQEKEVKSWSSVQIPELDKRAMEEDQWKSSVMQQTEQKCHYLGRVTSLKEHWVSGRRTLGK